MSLGAGHRAPRPRPSSGLLLLGLLLLSAAVALAGADPEGELGDQGCVCVRTTSRVRPKHVTSLEVIKAGLHCPTPQLIASLKNGSKLCLDPQTPLHKKIIKKLLEN
nr:platelet factor 4 isoform X1 [Manis javanica]